MIGTIIIAVIGYGFSIFCGIVGVIGIRAGFKGKIEADQAFLGAFLFCLIAVALAFGTRALAGGW